MEKFVIYAHKINSFITARRQQAASADCLMLSHVRLRLCGIVREYEVKCTRESTLIALTETMSPRNGIAASPSLATRRDSPDSPRVAAGASVLRTSRSRSTAWRSSSLH
ncbi:unnamed protein product [Euphydryas editha]|uniref:Uncharacterized protein n=1 Tax=Euphydryas editha TaxID=104508 RepID=A0AAU9TJT0_EUPED|nr:unnamed protein product [Euphydryas editha]